MFSHKSDLTDTVREISNIHFTGNVIPDQWYKHIKFENGKADLISINILADIIYWYRKTEVRDEESGQVTAYRKKFWSDKLQRSYSSLADKFGLTKRQVIDSVHRLEKLGLITIEFRNITKNTVSLANVLYLEPIVSKIKEISMLPPPIPRLNVGPSHVRTWDPPTLERGTYTENTHTETSSFGDIDVGLGKKTKKKNLKPDDHLFVKSVFEYWQKTLNHPKAKLDGHREYYIKRALRDGWNVVDLNKAILGCSKTPFNMGENDRGEVYDSIDLIFRDAKHIEKFIGYADNPPIPRPRHGQSAAERASRALQVAMTGNDEILKRWEEQDRKKMKEGTGGATSVPSQITRVE